MDHGVPKCHYPRQFRDLRRHIYVHFCQLVQRLSDNLELSFNGGAKQDIRLVVLEGFPIGKLVQEVRGAYDVP